MSKSVYDMNMERKVDHGGPDFHPRAGAKENDFWGREDIHRPNYDVWRKFHEGQHVKIMCAGQDHFFFYEETGVVENVDIKYLGIRVRFDEPRHFVGGMTQETFNFNPSDLLILDEEDLLPRKPLIPVWSEE